MLKYVTTGRLIEQIDYLNVSAAQEYLIEDDMSQYLDEGLDSVVESVEWLLNDNGLDYRVEVVANRELSDTESAKLSEWIRGQNSDGLGEGFEQQDFAQVYAEVEEICPECHGSGTLENIDAVDDDEEEEELCWCDMGVFTTEESVSASFDWGVNKNVLKRVE